MHRPPFFAILTLLLLGCAAGVALAIALAASWWWAAGACAGLAIVWLAWGPDEWWTGEAPARATPARASTARAVPAARPVTVTVDDDGAAWVASARRERTPTVANVLAGDYQPQCAALRNDGVQCRNSARGGSKYCSSHFGYQPRTAEGVVRQTDTVSKVARRDTVTSFAGDEVADTRRGAQCQALTAGDLQCKNTVRPGSQFCVTHAGYRSPTPEAVVRGRDSKPRWDKAPDTLPSTRKSTS